MNKKIFENYRANKRLIERNRKKIGEEQLRDIPIVSGKVKGSSSEFPYIERRFGVQVEDPVEAERQRKRISKWEAEIGQAEKENEEVDAAISNIADICEREIMTYRFIDGMKLEAIGKAVGYSKGRVSQIISKFLKD